MNTITSSICVLFKKLRQPLMYCSMVALTIGVQEIFQQVVFNCPCKRHFEYGLAFLCGPAILLFFLGIFLDDTLCRIGPRKEHRESHEKPCMSLFQVPVPYILCNDTSMRRSSCLVGSIFLATKILHLRILWTSRRQNFNCYKCN